jgi:hypothetical protein
MPSNDEILKALFTAGGGAGCWLTLRFGFYCTPQWSTSLAILFAGLVYAGIEYGDNS